MRLRNRKSPKWHWKTQKQSILHFKDVTKQCYAHQRSLKGVKWKSVPHYLLRKWECSKMSMEGVEVFLGTCHVSVWTILADNGGCRSVPQCSTLPMEGMEVFQAACGRRGSVPRCPWRARLEAAWSGSKRLEVARSNVEVAWSGWKLLEADRSCSKRLEAAQSGSKRLDADRSGLKWLDVARSAWKRL